MSWAFDEDDGLRDYPIDDKDLDDDFSVHMERLGLSEPGETVAGSGFSAVRQNSSGNIAGLSSAAAAARAKDSLMKPMPLIHFEADLESATTKTAFEIDGELPTIENAFEDAPGTGDLRKLHDPHHSLLIQKYFTTLSSKEAFFRENPAKAARENKVVEQEVVYFDKLLGAEAPGLSSSRPSSQGACAEKGVESTSYGARKDCLERRPVLTFNGEFESGNLDTACFINLEYDVTCRNDLTTPGNIQWFYFSRELVRYPLRVRFQIVNMEKKDSLYNYGMRPVRFSTADEASGWINTGEDVCYFKNNKKDKYARKLCALYSTVFTYTFDGPDTVYFAHTFPYTYSDLQRYLASLDRDRNVAQIMRRKLLCTTLAGNRCDVLTITGPCASLEDSNARPSIVISARVHPGEVMSSYMMHGIIDFLTGDSKEALLLRQRYVFKVIPMLNPDGVIHGNYRCSLAGADLNRKYRSNSLICYPTIVAMRSLLKRTHSSRGVSLFLDLHGHSKKKNAFVYGFTSQRIFSRLFPYMLSRMSDVDGQQSFFSFPDCCFGVGKSKAGTGRVVAWRDLGIPAAYTIELSFCGPGNNKEVSIINKAAKFLPSVSAASDKEKVNDKTSATTSSNNNNISALTSDVGDENDIASDDTDTTDKKPSRHGKKNSSGKKAASGGNTTGSTENIADELRKVQALLDTYPNQRAYGKDDLVNLGRQTALAIFYFSNLDRAEPLPTPSHPNGDNCEAAVLETKQEGVEEETLVADADSRPSSRATHLAADDDESFSPCKSIRVLTEEELEEAMIYPSVLSNSALIEALNQAKQSTHTSSDDSLVSPNSGLNFRTRSELCVRKMLKIPLEESLLNNPLLSNLDVDNFEEVASDDGSDSAPSENDVPEKVLIKTLGKKGRSRKDRLHFLKKTAKQPPKQVTESESEDEKSLSRPAKVPQESKRHVRRSVTQKRVAPRDQVQTVHYTKYRLDESSERMDPLSQLAAAQTAQCNTVDLSLGLPEGALVPSLGIRRKKAKEVKKDNASASIPRRRSFDVIGGLTSVDAQYRNATVAAQAAAEAIPTMVSRAETGASTYAQISRDTDRAMASRTSSGRLDKNLRTVAPPG
eukprot:GSChrysophyteH1.ASY1.ANO1.448.1 assembled CDS